MQPDPLPDFRENLSKWHADLEYLRQNRLLTESDFISFSKSHGIPVFGVTCGDPGEFLKRGWLENDQTLNDYPPLFHPFRMYPLHLILQACRLPIAASASLERDTFLDLAEQVLADRPSTEQVAAVIKSNRLVDLAILLEPIYWPHITGVGSRSSHLTDSEWNEMLSRYQERALALVGSLHPDQWRTEHRSLRLDAAMFDDNSELYLLVRLSSWRQRERLTGTVAGALWIRHIAEVIRRAFEEVHGVEWEEEDRAFGFWNPASRKMALGSERPLDNELKSKPHIALWWGLFTGSVVRWYVEGETEFYAIRYVLPEPAEFGIELMNLRGMIRAEKGNIALTLQQLLIEDKAQRRFSAISFDLDVLQNVKVVRAQVEQQNVIGLVTAHKPDFEFANFAIEELVEVAARIDEAHGISGDVVRNGDWNGVRTAKAFEESYLKLSARRPSGLKGKKWGEALAAYAVENPKRSDVDSERLFWREISAALRARRAHYDFQEEHFTIDPNTFDNVDLRRANRPPT